MTQVSKYRIDKVLNDQIFDTFIETVINFNSKKQAVSFLENFLTQTEKVMFSKRLAIGLLVSRNLGYREISSILKVSTGTVGVFAFRYKNNSDYKKIIDKINENKQISEFIINLAEKITKSLSFGGKGSQTWREINKSLVNKKSKLYQ